MVGKRKSPRKSAKKAPRKSAKKAPRKSVKKASNRKSAKKAPNRKSVKKVSNRKSVKVARVNKPVAPANKQVDPPIRPEIAALFDADLRAKNWEREQNLRKKISLPEMKGFKKENYSEVLKDILGEKIEELKNRKHIPNEWKTDRDTYYFDKNMFKKSFEAVYDNFIFEQERDENAKQEIGESDQEYADYLKETQYNRKMLEKLTSYVQEFHNIFENILDLSLKAYQSKNINDEDELNSIINMYTIYQGGNKRIDRRIKNKV